MKNKIIKPDSKKRLDSLDALRGFDMFWIVGGSAFFLNLSKTADSLWLNKLTLQFQHVSWAGFHFIDLIFPLFMFISGAVIPFSVMSKFEKGVAKNTLLFNSFKRTLVLIGLGIIYNGALKTGFNDARYVSILGQIGIAYFASVLILLNTNSFRMRLIWLISILTGIAFLQLFITVPGYGTGNLTPEGCINGYIDRLLLPGRLAYNENGWISSGNGIYDALGILSTISSVGITLMGTFVGFLLKNDKYSGYQKAGILAGTGIILIIFAKILHPFYPIIKNCWTSTFSLLAGGISFNLVALFFLIIDVWGCKKWSFYFRVIGMNPLFIYLIYRLVDLKHTAVFLFSWLSNDSDNASPQPVIAFGVILIVYSLLYFLYKHKIFIKI